MGRILLVRLSLEHFLAISAANFGIDDREVQELLVEILDVPVLWKWLTKLAKRDRKR